MYDGGGIVSRSLDLNSPVIFVSMNYRLVWPSSMKSLADVFSVFQGLDSSQVVKLKKQASGILASRIVSQTFRFEVHLHNNTLQNARLSGGFKNTLGSSAVIPLRLPCAFGLLVFT